MAFIGFAGGYAFFLTELFKIAKDVPRLKNFIASCKQNYREDSRRRKRLIQDIKKRLSHSVLIVSMIASFVTFIPSSTEATIPVLMNTGALGYDNCEEYIGETYQEVSTSFHLWVKYISNENQPPTYMRVQQYLSGIGSVLPYHDMLENDSSDTTYSNEKWYNYNWTWYSYIEDATRFRFYGKTANYSTEFQRLHYVYIEPPVRLDKIGISPKSSDAGNYSFYCRYVNKWDLPPDTIIVKLDGTDYPMTQNDSDDTIFSDGSFYFVNLTLDAGLHNYSFQVTDSFTYQQKNYDFWIVISEPADYNTLAIFIMLSMMIGTLLFVGLKVRKEG